MTKKIGLKTYWRLFKKSPKSIKTAVSFILLWLILDVVASLVDGGGLRVVFCAITLWLTAGILRGSNYHRWLLVVFRLLALPMLLALVFGVDQKAQAIYGDKYWEWLGATIWTLATILTYAIPLFLPSANKWFRESAKLFSIINDIPETLLKQHEEGSKAAAAIVLPNLAVPKSPSSTPTENVPKRNGYIFSSRSGMYSALKRKKENCNRTLLPKWFRSHWRRITAWGVGVMGVVSIGIVLWLAVGGRYVIMDGTDGVVYRTDRLTGRMDMIRGNRVYKVDDNVKTAVKQRTTIRALKLNEQFALHGRGGVGSGYSSFFSGTIYNGNKNVHVTDVVFSVSIIQRGKPEKRMYAQKVDVAPLSTSSFSFTILRGDEEQGHRYSWNIESAKGYDVDDE